MFNNDITDGFQLNCSALFGSVFDYNNDWWDFMLFYYPGKWDLFQNQELYSIASGTSYNQMKTMYIV